MAEAIYTRCLPFKVGIHLLNREHELKGVFHFRTQASYYLLTYFYLFLLSFARGVDHLKYKTGFAIPLFYYFESFCLETAFIIYHF